MRYKINISKIDFIFRRALRSENRVTYRVILYNNFNAQFNAFSVYHVHTVFHKIKLSHSFETIEKHIKRNFK